VGILFHLASLLNNGTLLSVGLNQSTRTALLASQRGTIYDRNLTPLVNKTTRFRGVLYPQTDLLNLIQDDVTRENYLRLAAALEKQELLMTDMLDSTVMIRGLHTFRVPQRYDSTVSCAHLLGYLDESGLNGQTGMEKAYNTLLEQYAGKITVTYNVNGTGACQTDQPLEITNTIDRCKGGIQLTIDAEIQRYLEELASVYLPKGATTVLDAQTGEILACTSLPTFHPEQIQTSIEQQDGALINRLLSGYDCGSVFKIVTAAAALEYGVTPEQTYSCAGEITVGNTVFHCHNRLGHHTLDMKTAFAQSCNLYFIQLAQQIGGEALLNTASAFGLYDPIDLADGLSAPAAILPDLDQLYPATLANLSFGQGALLITPLHVAQLTAIIANDGIRNTPTAVLGTVDEQGKQTLTEKGRGERVLSETTATLLQEMMEMVVQSGTGTRAQPELSNAAGKTGTAQTGQMNGDQPVIQSWFTGYFPAESPRYIITVLAEDAENLGGDAQALFRDLADKLRYKP